MSKRLVKDDYTVDNVLMWIISVFWIWFCAYALYRAGCFR